MATETEKEPPLPAAGFHRPQGTPADMPRITASLVAASHRLARAETWLAGLLLCGCFLLLIAGVGTRLIGRPLIWGDELAVTLMLWAAFVAASAAVAMRGHIAVTLVPDLLPPRGQRLLGIATDLSVCIFLGVVAVTVWLWFDPVSRLSAPDGDTWAMQSFNYIYQEPMTTLPVRKVWAWAILPMFTVTALFHAVTCLIEGLTRRNIRVPA